MLQLVCNSPDGAVGCICLGSIVVLLKAGKGSLVVTCKAKSPVSLNALGVYHMTEQLAYAPLTFGISEVELGRRNRVNKHLRPEPGQSKGLQHVCFFNLFDIVFIERRNSFKIEQHASEVCSNMRIAF